MKIATPEAEILKDGAFLDLRLSIAVVSKRLLNLLVSLHKYFQSLSYMVTHITIQICRSS